MARPGAVSEADPTAANRRGRGGRPRSPDPRTGQVMVRLTPGERARLDDLAGAGGVAEYLRATGLGKQPRIPRAVPEINREAWVALAPVLSNFNQLARHANEGGPVGRDLLPVLEAVRAQVVALRAALLGRDEEGATGAPGDTGP